jgi:hypothetical protein
VQALCVDLHVTQLQMQVQAPPQAQLHVTQLQMQVQAPLWVQLHPSLSVQPRSNPSHHLLHLPAKP